MYSTHFDSALQLIDEAETKKASSSHILTKTKQQKETAMSEEAADIETCLSETRKHAIMSGTPYVITKQFPWKLHEMLDLVEKRGDDDEIVSWLPGGKSFRVHMPDLFVENIMKLFFNQTKYKSFQRQLNLWGFERNTSECAEKGAYYHSLFIRGRRDLCQEMARQKVKRNAPKRAPTDSSPKINPSGSMQTSSKAYSVVSDDTASCTSGTSKDPPAVVASLADSAESSLATMQGALEAAVLESLQQQQQQQNSQRALLMLGQTRQQPQAQPAHTQSLGPLAVDAVLNNAIQERVAIETILQTMRERERSSTALFAAALSRAGLPPGMF